MTLNTLTANYRVDQLQLLSQDQPTALQWLKWERACRAALRATTESHRVTLISSRMTGLNPSGYVQSLLDMNPAATWDDLVEAGNARFLPLNWEIQLLGNLADHTTDTEYCNWSEITTARMEILLFLPTEMFNDDQRIALLLSGFRGGAHTYLNTFLTAADRVDLPTIVNRLHAMPIRTDPNPTTRPVQTSANAHHQPRTQNRDRDQQASRDQQERDRATAQNRADLASGRAWASHNPRCYHCDGPHWNRDCPQDTGPPRRRQRFR